MIQKIYSESFQKCTLPNSKRHSTSCADIHHDLITFEVDEMIKQLFYRTTLNAYF